MVSLQLQLLTLTFKGFLGWNLLLPAAKLSWIHGRQWRVERSLHSPGHNIALSRWSGSAESPRKQYFLFAKPLFFLITNGRLNFLGCYVNPTNDTVILAEITYIPFLRGIFFVDQEIQWIYAIICFDIVRSWEGPHDLSLSKHMQERNWLHE